MYVKLKTQKNTSGFVKNTPEVFWKKFFVKSE